MNKSITSRTLTARHVDAEQQLSLHTAFRATLLFFIGVEGLIGVSIVLKTIGAGPDLAFANFINNAAGLFLAPFVNLVGSPSAGGVVLQVPSLIAMLLYGLAGWLILLVVWPLVERPTTTGTSTFDRHRS